ncbi:hypothetical protein QUA27_11185 [Microcoleus sp. Pol14C6]|uniref:hypothetical protein n=1 Tax=unclassified Microcoleus TaxID=2642155 RepID=UPI002FD2DAE8
MPTEFFFLANSAKIVARPGYIAYMNCTYSTAENEQVNEWLLSKFPEFEPLTVPHLETYRSHLTEIPCYRMWPQDKLGAGAFTVLFQNTSDGERNHLPAYFRDLAHFTNL